ncbi:MAG TPA: hypothetical protein VLE89_01465 [Chlamydiales bacterium]|nr:hypothetical protein [Chlamydiales bacterium]
MLGSPLGAEEPADGWFPVEQPDKGNFDDEETDPSIWVVFAKSLAEEKFMVRFPEDPTYQISSSNALEMTSSKGGEQYRLWVQENGVVADPFEKRLEEVLILPDALLISIDEPSQDLFYRADGKWVREHFISTPSHTYLFQTSSPVSDGKNHQFFVNSFQLQ